MLNFNLFIKTSFVFCSFLLSNLCFGQAQQRIVFYSGSYNSHAYMKNKDLNNSKPTKHSNIGHIKIAGMRDGFHFVNSLTNIEHIRYFGLMGLPDIVIFKDIQCDSGNEAFGCSMEQLSGIERTNIKKTDFDSTIATYIFNEKIDKTNVEELITSLREMIASDSAGYALTQSLICLQSFNVHKWGGLKKGNVSGQNSMNERICHWMTKVELSLAINNFKELGIIKEFYLDGTTKLSLEPTHPLYKLFLPDISVYNDAISQRKTFSSQLYNDSLIGESYGRIELNIDKNNKLLEPFLDLPRKGYLPHSIEPLLSATRGLDKLPYALALNANDTIKKQAGFHWPVDDLNIKRLKNAIIDGDGIYILVGFKSDPLPMRKMVIPFLNSDLSTTQLEVNCEKPKYNESDTQVYCRLIFN